MNEAKELTHRQQMMDETKLGWHCEMAPTNPHMEDDPKHPMAHWYVQVNNAEDKRMGFHFSMGSGLCEQWLTQRPATKKRRGARARYEMAVRANGPMSHADHVKYAQKWGMQPSETDILLCLCNIALDGEPLFEEWCDNFGYDHDSIKARDTWQVCLNQQQDLYRIFPQTEEWWADAREEIDG